MSLHPSIHQSHWAPNGVLEYFVSNLEVPASCPQDLRKRRASLSPSRLEPRPTRVLERLSRSFASNSLLYQRRLHSSESEDHCHEAHDRSSAPELLSDLGGLYAQLGQF